MTGELRIAERGDRTCGGSETEKQEDGIAVSDVRALLKFRLCRLQSFQFAAARRAGSRCVPGREEVWKPRVSGFPEVEDTQGGRFGSSQVGPDPRVPTLAAVRSSLGLASAMCNISSSSSWSKVILTGFRFQGHPNSESMVVYAW